MDRRTNFLNFELISTNGNLTYRRFISAWMRREDHIKVFMDTI